MISLRNYTLFSMSIFLAGYEIFSNILGVQVTYFIQMTYFVICCFWALKYLICREKNAYLNIVLIFFVTVFVYNYLTGFSTTQFKSFGFSLLISVPFYMFSFNEKHIKNIFWILCFFSIASEFYNLNMGRERLGEDYYGGGYFALVTLPLGLYNLRGRKNLYKILWCLIIFSLVLYAVKRGDILGCMVAVVFYYITSLKDQESKNKFIGIINIIILLAVGYFIFQYALESSELLQGRLEATQENNSSGRDQIYSKLWHIWLNSDLTHLLLGYGINAPFKFVQLPAHSDWLEFLLSMGLLGALLYLSLFVALIFSYRKIYIPQNLIPIIITILSIWLIKSCFSMYLFSTSTVLLTIMIGYMLNPNVDHGLE